MSGQSRKQHNLTTVLRFEVFRTLRRRIFWIVTLGVPVLAGAIFALSAFSSTAGAESIDDLASQTQAFTYTDDSGIVSTEVVAELGGKPEADPGAAPGLVQQGRAEAYLRFPADPAKQPIEIYSQDAGFIGNTAYPGLARNVLETSAATQIKPALAAVLSDSVTVQSTAYADGVVSGGLGGFLPPLVFILLLFLVVTLLGNQMLNITVEEKENRVTEMILTSVKPTTLILGKVLAVCVVGAVQVVVFSIPTLIAGGFALSLAPPGFELEFLPSRMVLGFVLFMGGFLQFTGLLVCLGSIMPTAKDAGGAFTAVILTLFLPLYAVTLILSNPDGVVSQILTFFPLTAPLTALLRNAAGGLGPIEAGIVIVELFALSAALLWLGARLFRAGSLAYDRRLGLSAIRGSIKARRTESVQGTAPSNS